MISTLRRSRIQARVRRIPEDVLEFWRWLRAQRCAVCEKLDVLQRSQTQVAHIGIHGLGRRCSDWDVIPLCWRHHDRHSPDSHHFLGVRFWEVYGLDRERTIRVYRVRYQTRIPE